MTERDLTRPVIEVKDAITGALEYEIYKFGEETVVFPVKDAKAKKKPVEINEGHVRRILDQHVGGQYEVEFESGRIVVYVPEQKIGKLIGKQGREIAKLEKRIGAPVDIRPK